MPGTTFIQRKIDMKAYVESYGCSMNQGDGERIKGFLRQHSIELSSKEDADFLVLNTCGVKNATEHHMVRRAKELLQVCHTHGSQLIVTGCLPRINPTLVSSLSPEIVQFGPELEPLADYLSLPLTETNPAHSEVRQNPYISIIPIAVGCASRCTFCATKLARGDTKSHTIPQLTEMVAQASTQTPEIWLTGQDTGAYGLDIGATLPELIASLLSLDGNFRLRIGMMNPHHALRFIDALLPLFEDKRLYRFLHIPVQSGSDPVLRAMKRGYRAAHFLSLIDTIRSAYPDMTLSTDVIAGFPGETEADFQHTLDILNATCPDVVNISSYSARPNTPAASFPGQVPGKQKKARTRTLTKVCRMLSTRRNTPMNGHRGTALFTEKGRKGNFVGRTRNYKPVVVASDVRGQFKRVRVTGTHPTYLTGALL